MTIVSFPYVDTTLLPAGASVENTPHKVLMVGQMLNAGTATSGQLYSSIQNDGSENTLFGAGSQLAGMIRAFKKINGVSQLDVIPLEDAGGGTAATGSIAFSGTATEAGTIKVSFASEKNHTYSVSVASGDANTAVASALSSLVNADTKCPATTGVSTGTVTFTARQDGTTPNFYGIRVQGLPAGITATITAMNGGATDPTLTGVFDVVDGERYQTVVWPYTAGIATLTTNFLDGRFNVPNKVLDGVGIICKTDTATNHGTALDALNTQSLVYLCNKTVNDNDFKGGALLEINEVIASYLAAVRALRFTKGKNISRYVVDNSPRDQFGGPHLASKPYANTPLFDLPIIPVGKGFTLSEVETLNSKGGSVIGHNVTRTNALVGELYTTYKTDAAGNPDKTYKFLNNVDTAVNVREYFFNSIKEDFDQHRLTDGDLLPGLAYTNADDAKAAFIGYYDTLSGQEYALLRKGGAPLKFFKENLIVTLDLDDGQIIADMLIPIVVQARSFIVTQRISYALTV